jgi:lipopolysaccharide transport system permease protein
VSLYADLLRYPDLFGNLFRRELYARYKGSLLWVGWTFVNPLILMGVYTIVFSVLWRSAGVRHYPLFVISGLAIWMFFSGSIQTASSSLLGHANLLKQVKFPRQLLPLAVVGANLATYAAMLVVIAIVNLIVIPDTRSTIWAVIPLSLPLIALASGLAIVFAAVTVLYRDVEHLLLTILLPWFFLTPVFYSLEQLPGAAGHPLLVDILRFGNPVTPYVEGIRAAILQATVPGPGALAYIFLVGPLVALAGLWVLQRYDDRLAVEL